MARVLDLNSVQRPTLELTLQDADRTTIRLSTPTEAMVNELSQIDLAGLEAGDKAGVEMVYDLAARLISCNRDFIKVTAAELRGKYQMDLESAVIFFNAYMDFINEIVNAKN